MRLQYLLAVVGLSLVACGDNAAQPIDAAIDAPPPPVGPATVIDVPPPADSSATHVSVTFHAVGQALSFTCALDTTAPQPCTSPWVFDAGNGMHAISIVAVGPNDAFGPPATASFIVDTIDPDTVITAGPTGLVATATNEFAFEAAPASDGSHFECAIDDPNFTPCTSPASLTRGDGAHTFKVRAIDGAGNVDPTPATQGFTIDSTAPVVTLQAPLIAPRTSQTQPVVKFTATDANGVTTACGVDGGTTAACSGTTGFSAAAALSDGPHTYQIVATDGAGNVGTTIVTFTVDTTPPTVTITNGPSDPTNDATPTFTFTTSTDTTRASCAMDTGEVVDPCTSPVKFPTPLTPGTRTFTVTAFDDATPPNTASATAIFFLGVCGDGTAQGSEQCDESDLKGQSCIGLGFISGNLACTAGCTFDTSDCSGCGDGVIGAGEQCDGTNLGGATCQSQGFQNGTLACGPTCQFDDSACSTCGDGVRSGTEVCDGTDTGTTTCTSLGHAPGTLGCKADCSAFDVSTCDGGFKADNAGFTATVTPKGLAVGAGFVGAATEDQGVWKILANTPFNTWIDMNGITAGQEVTNLHGHVISMDAGNFAFVFTDPDATTGINAYRSGMGGNFTSATDPSTVIWKSAQMAALVFPQTGGTPMQAYAAMGASSTASAWGGWNSNIGAAFQHGNNSNTGSLVTPIVPSTDGVTPGATGTVTSIGAPCCSATSNSQLPSFDIFVTVFGQQPDGTPGTGGGIYWTCDTTATIATGGTFTEMDTGISAADKALVFDVVPDQSTFSSGNSAVCPTNGSTVFGFATTWLVGLRGGSGIYKSTDSGNTWAVSNTGLPAGAEVYQLVQAAKQTTWFAATSVGVYESDDSGATWTLAGLEGIETRSVVTIGPSTAFSVMAATTDSTLVYLRP